MTLGITPEQAESVNKEAAEPTQEDFTKNEYSVLYQGINRDGFEFSGREIIVENDPRNAAVRILEELVSKQKDIAHIRAKEVSIVGTEDTIIFFTGEAIWPPDPEDGPCFSPAAIPVDKRMVKAVVQIEKRTITTKDGSIILQLALKISGTQATEAERKLLDFRSGEALLMTMVAVQADLINGKQPEVAFDMGGEDETVAAKIEEDGTITPADPENLEDNIGEENNADDDEFTEDDI